MGGKTEESMARIFEMHTRDHELRMKYNEEEHKLKVGEHLVKMEFFYVNDF